MRFLKDAINKERETRATMEKTTSALKKQIEELVNNFRENSSWKNSVSCFHSKGK
jgi:uncharacterized membrane-anchored protein YhcB (DUF1043 family)